MTQEVKQPDLDPPEWPSRWLYTISATAAGAGASTMCGEGMRIEKNGSLTYVCLCGATFNRQPGELVEETREWIKEHSRPFIHAPA